MEIQKPWTVIFPLNELYYLARKEKAHRHILPIIGLKSRKNQRIESPQTLTHKPWEIYTQTTVNNLTISYNAKFHEGFTLQDQAKRNRKRGLKATFIDELILKKEKTKDSYYILTFKCTHVPKDAETLKDIQKEIKYFKRKYGLYPEISKKDRSFYGRIFKRPSCLELREARYYHPRFKQKDPPDMINGLTDKSQRFMGEIMHFTTKNMAWDVHKRLDEKSEFILDAIIPPEMIKKRFNFEGNVSSTKNSFKPTVAPLEALTA